MVVGWCFFWKVVTFLCLVVKVCFDILNGILIIVVRVYNMMNEL